MSVRQVLTELETLADPEKVGLKEKKFGIYAKNSLGVYHKDLIALAKEIGRDNQLGIALYETGIYEARILCSKICDPEHITEQQMDRWAADFENWEICDSFCMGFFAMSKFAVTKAHEWAKAEPEFVKRAGFVLMAAYGFANKESDNSVFEEFLEPIEREAGDDRLYVKKAINWALRNIGKRNIDLQAEAIQSAERILATRSRAAGWVARNALRELQGPNVKIMDYPRSVYRL